MCYLFETKFLIISPILSVMYVHAVIKIITWSSGRDYEGTSHDCSYRVLAQWKTKKKKKKSRLYKDIKKPVLN